MAGRGAAEARYRAATALVALTHDPKIDDPALAAALRSRCFYIGALGSKKTQGARHERLTAAGFGEADLERIHGPIGLSIGARGPAEIAISIIAEITAALRVGRRMKFGEIAVGDAVGADLAHSVSHATGCSRRGG